MAVAAELDRPRSPVSESQSPTGSVTGLSPEEMARGYRLLGITMLAMTIAMSLVESIQPNFFRDELGMNGAENGYLIAIREVPGFLLILVAAVLLRLGIARATSISLAVAGVGYILFAPTQSFYAVIIPTLISSIGYHSWLQLQPALGLSLARKGEEGSVLGRFSGLGFFGSMLAMSTIVISLLVVEWHTGDLRAHQGPVLRAFFVIAAVSAVIGAVAIRRFPTSHEDRAAARVAPRITWRREYRLYYALSFLDGSRMQIYFAFAPFVLVEHFKVTAISLNVVLILAAMIKWRMGPIIGQAVDRYGEKRILTAGYVMHLTVFVGFALAPNVWIAYICYLGYNFLFLFSIGTTTYLKKICRREDLAPSLAMGVSLSHLTAIIVPIFGAALWDKLGYQFPFLFGTLFIFGSLYVTQRLDPHRQSIREAVTSG